MGKVKFTLDLTPDEKSALRANLHRLEIGTALFNKLSSMTTKQRIAVFSNEYDELEKLLLIAINDNIRYPNKAGNEYESLNNALLKLRASAYE